LIEGKFDASTFSAELGNTRQESQLEAMKLFARVVFGGISLSMMLIAAGLIVVAGIELIEVFSTTHSDIGRQLLKSIGYTVIAVAVFEVAKFIFEENVIDPTELKDAGEARRSMTKFITTIAIAVFLEALVAIFEASRADALQNMLYPTIVLLAGVALIVGLGAYQRLSASAEKEARGAPGEPTSKADLKEQR
jgi:hypothetical protein